MNNVFRRSLSFLVIISFVLIFSVNYLSYAAVDKWNDKQLQKIDNSKTNFSFAVFGDSRDSEGRFDTLLEKISNDDLLFAIDIGDFVSRGERAEYESYLAQVKKVNKPLLTAFGNHEMVVETGRADYKNFFGDYYYSFSAGNSFFIVLDVNESTFDDQQLAWLKKEMLKSQKYKYRFVFFHTPLYDPRVGEYGVGHSLKDVGISQVLSEVFVKNNVTMVFAGHIHGYYKGSWSRNPYIITGGAGAPLQGKDPEHFFYHYIRVEVSDDEVKYKVVKF